MASTTHAHGFPDITPEKLAIMKLNSFEHNSPRDAFSEPTTPILNRKTLDFGGIDGIATHGAASRSLARTSRHMSRSSRRTSSFMTAHKSKMSSELTASAENKFFSLIELMANASREASSLKELWARIASERETFTREREELLEEISEVSQQLELRDNEQHRHGHEHVERKRQVEKLLLELSAALANVSTERKKVAERDHELNRVRQELTTIRDTHTRSQTDSDKIRTELEALKLAFTTTEGDRDSAREEADRYQRDLHKVSRERTEISTRLTDITSKFESSRKEVLSITDRLKLYDLEREETLHDLDRLKEDARKARLRADDSARELIEMTEKHDRLTREMTKIRETVRIVESERDEHVHTLEHLRRELKNSNTSRDEAEERHSDISLKYEHIKRELLSIKEKLRDVELERNDVQETIERTREQHRLIVIERDELKDELTNSHKRADDLPPNSPPHPESLRRTESLLTDVRSEITTHTERIKVLDRERDDAGKHTGHLHTEIAELKERITLFQAEIRTVTDARDHLRADLDKTRREYEEVTETITTYSDDSKELEFEIESLRVMLREAREQKERAITARNTADRERDDYIGKYEEKCRELERFEESAASHYHSSVKSSGGARSMSSRVVSRAGTTIHHGSGSHGEQQNGAESSG